MAKDTNADQVQTGTEHDTVEKLGHALDEWRTRVDELLVQFDLGASNVRDEVRKRLEIAQNVYFGRPLPAGRCPPRRQIEPGFGPPGRRAGHR